MLCSLRTFLARSSFSRTSRLVNFKIMAGGNKARSPFAFTLLGRRWFVDISSFFLKLTPIFRPSSPTISFVSSRVSLEIFGIPWISKQSRLEYRLSALNDYFKAFNWFVVPRNSAFRLLFSLTSSVIPLVG